MADSGSPTRYAMKAAVAELFRQARLTSDDHMPVHLAGDLSAESAGLGYQAWSFLSLARLASGEAAYPDELVVRYVFDSTVANRGSVRPGDLALIRDDGLVLGAGWIEHVQAVPGQKIRNRCPLCGRTDFKFRSKSAPPFRCAECGTEFETRHTKRSASSSIPRTMPGRGG